jgi:aspartate/methionine/tyrosine aminotransferase
MKVEIHSLFEYLLATTDEEPEAVIGFSLSRSPKLGDFLDELNPEMSLDWNNRSFQGLPELRDHVLRQAGLGGALSPDDVLITAGAAEANYLAMRQLLGPDCEIVTETPGWPQAGVLASAIGARLRTVERTDENGWEFPMDELAAVVNERTRMIFLSNPNNPTGRLLSGDELRQIVDLAAPHGSYVLIDEVYAGLEWAGQRTPSIAGIYERGITTGSVSKSLGLQGLYRRIGKSSAMR